ncbi:metal-dependent hydrolase [Saccharopolyspora erythraea]|uniref:metal-dependent hydrolase n=1 Tax=Saccharopolyspora erythraea TaxID=1836 RepID=UPI001BA9B09C|nr:metal-dependent hydrolase [Saccharopolyspora erythraea]QUH02983.1 metal-dependent hydrolase [Saccharopolyspora erythraea]
MSDQHEHLDPGEPDRVALHARDVEFDWAELPMHWIPGEPFATHMINVLHLLLPEGERWFVEVFKQALPLIRDEHLLEDVRGFIGQEAMHAESHQGVIDHFDAHGLDTTRYVEQVTWMFRKVLGDRPYEGERREEWLVERLALVAAIEHFTAFLGQWILDADALDEAGADPTMLDLLRWHGAEEVEHRSVAYDLYMHVDGRYGRRARAMVIAGFALFVLWTRGVRYLMRHDPVLRGSRKARWRDLLRSGRLGITPSLWQLLRAFPSFFRRSYHPSQHGSTSQAIAYLAKSPAAQSAEH